MSKPRNARAELEHALKMSQLHWQSGRELDAWLTDIPRRAMERHDARGLADVVMHFEARMERLKQTVPMAFSLDEARERLGFDPEP